MVVFCGVARKVRRFLAPCASNTRRDRRVDFERLKGGWRYHPAGALGKNTRQFFSIRMTDEQRYPPIAPNLATPCFAPVTPIYSPAPMAQFITATDTAPLLCELTA